MRKIAIINQKGGCGKTTTAVHLSATLAEMGHRVLAIDCDSQGDLSTVYLPDHERLPCSIADIFANTGAFTADILHPTPYQNLAVIPADERLNAHDLTHGYEDDPRAHCLADALSEVEADFDLVIFDCPPRTHLTTFAALVASTDVIVPVEPHEFAIRGTIKLNREVDLARGRLNPGLKIRGYFLSMVKPRSATHRSYRQLLVSALGPDLIFKTAIPELAAFDTALNMGLPITAYQPRGKAAGIMREFAQELLEESHGSEVAA
ncbi:MAG TPA: ParA family protein [Isosphaeraceae bacterium]|jgi:chromosome partitioning protein|nr:ParA family protein [Isosphaeraceae bacterium]